RDFHVTGVQTCALPISTAIGGVRAGASGFLVGLIETYIRWLLWSGLTYLIGDKLLGGTATWGELLRTLGFAHVPRALLVLAVIRSEERRVGKECRYQWV